MRQRVAAGSESDFHLALGEERPRNRGAEKIFVFIDAAGPYHAPQVVGDELLAQVGDVNLRRAGLERFLLESGELFSTLSDVAADGDHVALIIFLEPRNDDRGIEAAGVR